MLGCEQWPVDIGSVMYDLCAFYTMTVDEDDDHIWMFSNRVMSPEV